MKYVDFEELISSQRLARYKIACNNNARRTLILYRANMRISQAFLAVLGLFEVVLRNKIDYHYKNRFHSLKGHPDWLLAATLPGGFLTQNGCQSSLNKITQAHTDLGERYTHDKLLAALSFGFWKFLFAGRQFLAGGGSLLTIFTRLPTHRNQKFIFNKLNNINSIRNRVAHHEPICFGPGNIIGTEYARSHYQEIMEVLNFMNINGKELFFGIDNVIKEAEYIDKIKRQVSREAEKNQIANKYSYLNKKRAV